MGVLDVVGLDETQQRVYAALAAADSATVRELQSATGLTSSAVTSALSFLRTSGLAERHVSPSTRWGLTPPELALDALVYKQQQALSQVRAYAQQLAEQARQQAGRRSPAELVSLAEGNAVVNAHFEQLQRAAKREVLTFDRPPYPNTAGTQPNQLEVERIREGVKYRVLYDLGVLDHPGMFARVQVDLAAGETARVIADLPMKLAIADRTLALLPLMEADETHELAALVIRPSVLLDSLALLFEVMWQRAAPLQLGTRSVPEVDPEIIEVTHLLAAGMSDQRIARHLGVSERTVRRKISTALDTLGAGSRFQAGVLAQRLGWLPGGE